MFVHFFLFFISLISKTFYVFQYYRQARVKAIQAVYPDYIDESSLYGSRSNLNFSRPFSEPPSPSSSSKFYYSITTKYFINIPNTLFVLIIIIMIGHTTPAPSVHGSDDEDSVDEETELKELGIK